MEYIVSLILLFGAMCARPENAPLYCTAAGLFAIAGEISDLKK